MSKSPSRKALAGGTVDLREGLTEHTIDPVHLRILQNVDRGLITNEDAVSRIADHILGDSTLPNALDHALARARLIVDGKNPDNLDDDDTLTVSAEAMAATNARILALEAKLAASEKEKKAALALADKQSRDLYFATAQKSFFELKIGSWNCNMTPLEAARAGLMSAITDKQNRTILLIPVVLNDRPLLGKPYTQKKYENGQETGDLETRYNFDLGKTNFRESPVTHRILLPSGKTHEISLSGFAAVQISSKDAQSVLSLVNDGSPDSTSTLYDSNEDHPASGLTARDPASRSTEGPKHHSLSTNKPTDSDRAFRRDQYRPSPTDSSSNLRI